MTQKYENIVWVIVLFVESFKFSLTLSTLLKLITLLYETMSLALIYPSNVDGKLQKGHVILRTF